MLINDILKEFDEKFGRKEHKDDCRIHDPIDYDFGCNCGKDEGDKDIKDFIKSALTRTREECAKTLEEICEYKKLENPSKFPECTWNTALDEVKSDAASKIKEMK